MALARVFLQFESLPDQRLLLCFLFGGLAAPHGRFVVFNADAVGFFGSTTTATSFVLVDD